MEAVADGLTRLTPRLSSASAGARLGNDPLHSNCQGIRALLAPDRRDDGAHGGRGSAKSEFFAGRLVESCLLQPGLRAVCCREIQKSLAESAKRTIEDMIARFGVGAQFGIYHDKIVTPGGGSITFWGLADKQAESIKSLEGMDVCWIEEAQNCRGRSF